MDTDDDQAQSQDDLTSPTPDPDDKKHEESKPPSVKGEEDPMSGDATSSESPDLDEELEKVGLQGDEDGVKPLGVKTELDEEEK